MSVWQAAFFALVQQTTHVNDIKRDLYSRRDLGPLAWWLVARLASFVDQTFCEKAATRGLDKHRREALLVDARRLLDPQSSVGRGLRHMLGTAAKLTDEEFKTLGNFAAKQDWIRDADAVGQVVQRIRQAEPTEDPIIAAIAAAWDVGLGDWLDKELRSLWGRDPFLDSAFPLNKAVTPPSSPPWVGKR